MLAGLLVFARSDGDAAGILCLGLAAAWFAVLVLVVRPVLTRLAAAGDQVRLVCGVALALLSAAVSEGLGTGYLIGAFVAGAIMPVSCRAALISRLEMVTLTVLLPFFFMSTGLKALVEPGSARFLGLVAIALAATVGGKLVGTAIPARRQGFSWPDSLSLGAMMQTKGLMEVVVLGVLHDAGMIGSPVVFSVMVAMGRDLHGLDRALGVGVPMAGGALSSRCQDGGLAAARLRRGYRRPGRCCGSAPRTARRRLRHRCGPAGGRWRVGAGRSRPPRPCRLHPRRGCCPAG